MYSLSVIDCLANRKNISKIKKTKVKIQNYIQKHVYIYPYAHLCICQPISARI